jgi:hypothetical protein
MNRLIKYLTLAAAVAGLAATARAIPTITGGVSLSGGYILDTGNLATAHGFTSFSSVVVAAAPTGSYVGTAGDAVTMKPFTFDPITVPVVDLWKFTGPSSVVYSFELDSMSVDFRNSSSLLLSGSGILNIVGPTALTSYAPTTGTWTFTANSLGGTFSFSSSNGAAGVPDGGTTALLLGAGLTGLALISRRQKRKS